MNEFRERREEQEQASEGPAEQQPREKGKLIQAADYAFFLDKENAGRLMPYIFFLAFLAVLYIYNSNHAIRMIRDCDRLTKEIKEHRAEFISVKSEFMYRSKQSQVSKRLDERGLKELKQPPIKITFSEDEDEY